MGREPHHEGGSRSGSSLGADRATVELHEPPGDGEPQTGPGPRPCWVDAVEPVEDRLELILGDARATLTTRFTPASCAAADSSTVVA